MSKNLLYYDNKKPANSVLEAPTKMLISPTSRALKVLLNKKRELILLSFLVR